MARRHVPDKRKIEPDPRFGDETFARFLSALMRKGKRSLAEKIFYGALERLENAEKKEGRSLFYEILEKCRPSLEVRSRRVGGATYPVPVEVRPERAQALAFKWMISSAQKRSEKIMRDRLAAEWIDILNGRGATVKKRDDTHKMAEANRAFAHYRW
jgi:small subunit ribosomal protein S7